ncbi:transmembrane protein, putative (macronuclear) [Tetrahymena thermophila SB210]|uniref:Transmembrane protein, putative n=1 Tax=Tetrahymena thermophila (strain SB210) TaxID=312017 RepID=I7MCU3_TETTS|nr:transmembrane protein, putative [Tetrahymena thermophila SB210]EAR84938.1 transmembrane protein, putative [Tetrahymena thermophila SB210]|eukprot:XP_001032601.1 transmembrane protein, putative [Tetrahymena thermophila SB210]
MSKKNKNSQQIEEQSSQQQEPQQSYMADLRRENDNKADCLVQDNDLLPIKQRQNIQDNCDQSLNNNLCFLKFESNQIFKDSPTIKFLQIQQQNEKHQNKMAQLSLENQAKDHSYKDFHHNEFKQNNNNKVINEEHQQHNVKKQSQQYIEEEDQQMNKLQFPNRKSSYIQNQRVNEEKMVININNQNDQINFLECNSKGLQTKNININQQVFNNQQNNSKQLVLNAEETQLEKKNIDSIEEQDDEQQQKYPEYFNLTNNEKLEEICSKVNFVRNTLSRHFGKLRRNGQIVENESLLQIDQEFKLTDRQKQQRDLLVLSLRRRSQIFLILNVIWVIIIGLTYIQSENWFKMKTLDNLSLQLLVTADGITILQLVVWIINILVGLNGMANFSLLCLKIYQIAVLITIFFEILTNVLILNFVPISLAKSLALILFHLFFIFASKIVQNAMLAFRERYIPILYHYQLSFSHDETASQQTSNNQQTKSQIKHKKKDQIIFNQGLQFQSRIDEKNPFGIISNMKQYPAQVDEQNSTDQKSVLPQNLQKNCINNNQSDSTQNQLNNLKQQSSCISDQVQTFLLANKAQSNKSEESKEQTFKQQIIQQKNQKEKKIAFSVAELQGDEERGFQQKKSDIGSFPVYEKNQEKRIDQEEQNIQLEIFNQDVISNPSEKNLQLNQLKSTHNKKINIERKETILSSNAQGSQTTLPSNNCYIQRNNPSQICANLDDEEINVDIA